ncbi:hypothetical protein T439DRAFT_362497 [Meredithblackwellia eburnea MCA 4105]
MFQLFQSNIRGSSRTRERQTASWCSSGLLTSHIHLSNKLGMAPSDDGILAFMTGHSHDDEPATSGTPVEPAPVQPNPAPIQTDQNSDDYKPPSVEHPYNKSASREPLHRVPVPPLSPTTMEQLEQQEEDRKQFSSIDTSKSSSTTHLMPGSPSHRPTFDILQVAGAGAQFTTSPAPSTPTRGVQLYDSPMPHAGPPSYHFSPPNTPPLAPPPTHFFSHDQGPYPVFATTASSRGAPSFRDSFASPHSPGRPEFNRDFKYPSPDGHSSGPQTPSFVSHTVSHSVESHTARPLVWDDKDKHAAPGAGVDAFDNLQDTDADEKKKWQKRLMMWIGLVGVLIIVAGVGLGIGLKKAHDSNASAVAANGNDTTSSSTLDSSSSGSLITSKVTGHVTSTSSPTSYSFPKHHIKLNNSYHHIKSGICFSYLEWRVSGAAAIRVRTPDPETATDPSTRTSVSHSVYGGTTFLGFDVGQTTTVLAPGSTCPTSSGGRSGNNDRRRAFDSHQSQKRARPIH